jgi:hypothetical protein
MGMCSRSRARREAGGNRSAYPPSSSAACSAASSQATARLLCATFHSASAGHSPRAQVMACSAGGGMLRGQEALRIKSERGPAGACLRTRPELPCTAFLSQV